jgi:pimeloyl-ACP methyl ester carboxylesterase
MHGITISTRKLECRTWGGVPSERPTIVLLHEGLGSVGLWRSFPAKLAERTGCCVFAYSRAGYGSSDQIELPRPLDYMHREAVDVLPAVLDAIGFRSGILLGHSDGASIAAIHAGTFTDPRVCGIGLIAPHFFTEPGGLAAIAEAKAQYENGDLRDRLARYHADVDNAFRGWCDAWLDPGFKSWNIEAFIGAIQRPLLAIQGRDDQYGTLMQVEALAKCARAPLDVHILDNCKHSPHLEQPDRTLAIVTDFLARLDSGEMANAADAITTGTRQEA